MQSLTSLNAVVVHVRRVHSGKGCSISSFASLPKSMLTPESVIFGSDISLFTALSRPAPRFMENDFPFPLTK